ncbi:hypothetical protein ACFL1X_14215 [Candidatus Hydrogenedentota bacterium]
MNGTDVITPKDGFDVFVGFIYATTIALMLSAARPLFNSFLSVVLILLVLVFFAQDWMVRLLGRPPKSFILLFVKALFDIAIVYFLLLASLRLVEIVLISGWKPFVERNLDKDFCYKMAGFAIASGIWNGAMMKIISLPISWKEILTLFKGHLDEDIVVQFPKFEKWQENAKSKKDDLRNPIRKEVANPNGDENYDDEEFDDHIDKVAKLRRAMKWGVRLNSLKNNPHHLVLPYFFILHIVVLNLVLGLLIFLSTFLLKGKSLCLRYDMLPFLYVALPIIVLLLLALFLLAAHFESNIKQSRIKQTWYERCGCACVALIVLLAYAACPVNVLVFLVVAQQIAANIFMSHFFEPTSTRESEEEPAYLTPQTEQPER